MLKKPEPESQGFLVEGQEQNIGQMMGLVYNSIKATQGIPYEQVLAYQFGIIPA